MAQGEQDLFWETSACYRGIIAIGTRSIDHALSHLMKLELWSTSGKDDNDALA